MAKSKKTSKSTTDPVPAPIQAVPPRLPIKERPGFFFDVYRFLASLKLAVIGLTSLAVILAYATFYESWYGTEAARQYVYRGPVFYIINLFLFVNILCAATIRYPWKRHQTGFVVTHLGLLTLIVGSLISQKFTDDGQLGLSEGESSRQLIRTQKPIVRVRVPEKDSSGKLTAMQEYELDLFPGAFPWKPGRTEKVTQSGDPFQFEVIGFLPEAKPRFAHESVPDGLPMIDAHLLIAAPNQLEAQDVLDDGVGRWLKADARFGRVARSIGPATIAFQFVPANDPDLASKVADFLDPPKLSSSDGTARLHYVDKSGKNRTFDWVVDGKPRKETLPDSDITVEYLRTQEGGVVLEMPTRLGAETGGSNDLLFDATAEEQLGIVRFKVTRADGPSFDHYGWPDLIQAPSLVPGDAAKGGAQIVRISYLRPRPQGLFGYVEVLGTGDGKLFYRVFGREGFRTAAELKKGESVQAFAGGGGMTGKLRVDDFLPSGQEKLVYLPANLPVGQKGNGLPAIHAKMSVNGQEKDFWIRRSPDLKPLYQSVRFGEDVYEIAYDVDRMDLDFEIKLVDFEVGVDPGTEQASSFESRIELTDSKKRVNREPVTISMNNPLIWRGYTFYQSNYIPGEDANGRRTGEFISVFQVRHDRVWGITYLGCLIIVLGIFLQFYMKSGPFKLRSTVTERNASGPASGKRQLEPML